MVKIHGLIPPSSKIFSDLNPAWGKFGNIVIRKVSETSCLIMIPCISTREWVLQVGYCQAGNCAFSIYPWSADGSLHLPELETAPTWTILENVPPQMYSLDGISVIASTIGEPLHTEKSNLDPYYFGNTKIKVEVSLYKPPLTSIIVRDSMLNSVKVSISYPRLPPKCCNCGRFGHLLNRYLKPLMRKQPVKDSKKGFALAGIAIADTITSLANVASGSQLVSDRSTLPSSSKKRTHIRAETRRRSKERSRSSPHVESTNFHKSDNNMSVQTQEQVKAWIKECSDRKLLEAHAIKSEAKAVAKKQWIVVGAKKKGKEKDLSQGSQSMGKVYTKTGFAEVRKQILGA